MATISIVLVVVVDYESICTYKSLFESSVMLQSIFLLPCSKTLGNTSEILALSRVAMPLFSEGAEFFTPLCPLYYLRDSHDGTTSTSVLTTRPSKTWPLPITSSSVLEN
jgi:hypothetical protein